MEEEGGGIRLSKRFSEKEGEVDYKTKAGTAWSHSYLNQKPWHPLSYPNQRRKWIAEQTHSQRQRRADEVAREYAQEQDFLRQTSLLSQKEKEKVDLMQAVSFMYVRPPGYNAESAKAAEVADEKKKLVESDPNAGPSSSVPQAVVPMKEEKRKPRPKDVFGRTLPTEEEFAVLKNAPRLETGVPGRVKPFAVEVRNVKCVRCGNFGHQSGDRECPLKDVIMPNDENRLKRDDPLTAIVAHMDSSEPLKWELKQKPGISPPRGGFMADDPNQQIVAEDIFDEYGGFLGGGGIPELLTNFSSKKHKKSRSKSKHIKQASSRRSHDGANSTSDNDGDLKHSESRSKCKSRHKKRASSTHSDEENDSSENDKRSRRKSKNKKTVSSHLSLSEDLGSGRYDAEKQTKHTNTREENGSLSDSDRHHRRSRRREHRPRIKKDVLHSSFEDSESRRRHGKSRHRHSHHYESPDSGKHRDHHLPKHRELRVHAQDSSPDRERNSRKKGKTQGSQKPTRNETDFSSSSSELERHRDKRKHKRCQLSDYSDADDRNGNGRQWRRHHRHFGSSSHM